MKDERKCRKCQTVKPLEYFCKDPKRLAGYSYICKLCFNKYHREVVYPRRKDTPEFKERHSKAIKQYRQNNPDKVRAHLLAQKVPKSNSCDECGATGRLHKHHPDYSKPKEIVTLCVQCHVKAHHGVLI